MDGVTARYAGWGGWPWVAGAVALGTAAAIAPYYYYPPPAYYYPAPYPAYYGYAYYR